MLTVYVASSYEAVTSYQSTVFWDAIKCICGENSFYTVILVTVLDLAVLGCRRSKK